MIFKSIDLEFHTRAHCVAQLSHDVPHDEPRFPFVACGCCPSLSPFFGANMCEVSTNGPRFSVGGGPAAAGASDARGPARAVDPRRSGPGDDPIGTEPGDALALLRAAFDDGRCGVFHAESPRWRFAAAKLEPLGAGPEKAGGGSEDRPPPPPAAADDEWPNDGETLCGGGKSPPPSVGVVCD